MICEVDGEQTTRSVSDPSTLLNAGVVIGERYAIEEIIGRGGYGVVYGARHLRTDHMVAVKMLQVDASSNERELKRRFIQEAATTARLSHPNTVRVFDFGETDNGGLFIAMERLVGETLQARLHGLHMAGELMPFGEVFELADSVLRSLNEAHAHELVHRDLKPANIFLHEVAGGDSIVKVLDFGIVKSVNTAITQAGQAMGTPTHMSPEQAMGKTVDARSDVYSMGCVLFECVTGDLPYSADNPLAMVMQHLTETVPSVAERAPRSVPAELCVAIEKALAKEPEDRWPDCNSFRKALSSIRWVAQPEPDTSNLTQSPDAAGPLFSHTLPAIGQVGLELSTADTLSVELELVDDRHAGDDFVIGQDAIPSEGGGHDKPVSGRGSAPVPMSPPMLSAGLPDLFGALPVAERPASTHEPGADFDAMMAHFSRGLDQLTAEMRLKNDRRGLADKVRASASWVSADGQEVIWGDGAGAVRAVKLPEITERPSNYVDAESSVHVGEHEGPVTAVLLDPTRRLVVSAALDDTVRLWRAQDGVQHAQVDLSAHPTCLSLSTDGKLLLVGTDDGSATLVDMSTCAPVRTLRGHKDGVNAVAMAGSRREMVTAGERGVLRAWDPVGGGARLSARGHEGAIADVAMSACGSLVVSGGWDGSLRLWQPRTGETLRVIEDAHADIVAGVAICLPSKLFASTGDDGQVKIWSTETGECIAERTLESPGKTLAFSDDGRCVYVSTWAGVVTRLSAVGPLN